MLTQFNRKHDDNYIEFGLVAILLGMQMLQKSLVCAAGLEASSKAMKALKLLWHLETQHFALKDKPLEYCVFSTIDWRHYAFTLLYIFQHNNCNHITLIANNLHNQQAVSFQHCRRFDKFVQ